MGNHSFSVMQPQQQRSALLVVGAMLIAFAACAQGQYTGKSVRDLREYLMRDVQNAHFEKVDIVAQKGRMVMYTSDDVDEDKAFVNLGPLALISKLHVAHGTEFGKEMTSIGVDEDDLLTLHLIREMQDSKSEQKLYLGLIPTTFDSVAFWDKEDFEVLGGLARDKAEGTLKILRMRYEAMFPKLDKYFRKPVSFATWARAETWVRRELCVLEHEDVKTTGLVPMFTAVRTVPRDEANTEPVVFTLGQGETARINKVSLVSQRDLRSGEEITRESPRNMTSLVGLLETGEVKEAEDITEGVEFNWQPPLRKAQGTYLKEHELDFGTHIFQYNKFPSQLFKIIEVAVASDEELKDVGRSVALLDRAMRGMEQMIDGMLARHKHSRVENKALLRDTKTKPRHRKIIQIRDRELALLEHIKDLVLTREPRIRKARENVAKYDKEEL